MRVAIVGAVLALFVVTPSVGAAPRDLAAERLTAASDAFAAAKADYDVGRGAIEAVHTWSVRWLDAEPKRPTARKDHLARMRALEAAAQEKVQAGLAPALDAKAAAYFRVEAELWAAEKPAR
ncbi:MAG: hypothetical protein EP329_10735 [Deltaproteobacteria bacterium]|nr:MAG: hypothetical protein EP329_10735 [Deltaproteobacteria bacterium]